mmetsp:Transcript_28794/g.63448  ORF Transcript_28794/g.63448 Transcript_28794/m.63448 type:complete len:118 (+) Transcript_28794:379-732(+)
MAKPVAVTCIRVLTSPVLLSQPSPSNISSSPSSTTALLSGRPAHTPAEGGRTRFEGTPVALNTCAEVGLEDDVREDPMERADMGREERPPTVLIAENGRGGSGGAMPPMLPTDPLSA